MKRAAILLGLAALAAGCGSSSGTSKSEESSIVYAVGPGTVHGIHVRDPDGKTRQISNGQRDWYPTWSPDGKQIAFVRPVGREGLAHLFVMDADGENVHQVGTVVAAADAVSWSPEGGRLVFVDGTGGISKVNEDGTELTSITANGSSPAWSPDGKTIVFRQAPKLYAMNADGRGMHVLIRLPNSNEHIYSDAAPSWSPDGKHVVFVRTDLFRIIKPGAVAIEIVNPDGTGERVVARISFTEPDVARPSWSPDGTKIAFAGQQNGRRGIWAVKSTGGMPRLFAESNAYAMPSWGPAGT